MSAAVHSAAVYRAVPQLGRLREEVLFGDVWTQPELGPRDRSLVTCAILAAQGNRDELQVHLRRALENGVTADEIRGLIVQVAFYAGWPAGLNAARRHYRCWTSKADHRPAGRARLPPEGNSVSASHPLERDGDALAPPMHMVESKRLPPFAASSSAAVPMIRAPDIPSGWPSAMAPPFRFTRGSSQTHPGTSMPSGGGHSIRASQASRGSAKRPSARRSARRACGRRLGSQAAGAEATTARRRRSTGSATPRRAISFRVGGFIPSRGSSAEPPAVMAERILFEGSGSFPDRLKRLLAARGLTPSRLAEAAGTPPDWTDTIVAFASTEPRIEDLVRLARALDCAPGRFAALAVEHLLT